MSFIASTKKLLSTAEPVTCEYAPIENINKELSKVNARVNFFEFIEKKFMLQNMKTLTQRGKKTVTNRIFDKKLIFSPQTLIQYLYHDNKLI